jgi:hypothetical protein
VYSAEHYVADILADLLLAVLVHLGTNRVERVRLAGTPPDTLAVQSDTESQLSPAVETQCLPTDPLPETTPSST